MLFCGTGSFKDVDGKAAAPEAKKKKQGGGGGGGKKENPYASRGLDKFSTVFAICCTSVWWYLVPILTASSNGAGGAGGAHGVRRSKAAVKVLGKKASDKKMAVTPLLGPSHGKRGSSGVHELISPRSHPHGKKG
ncbi:hypothetical protein OsJ_24917 [Oryza sativa Japonica Group]|uniref:Uncharacterized protein n=1 Tax=Oryza sativa subsp. japonica TaxID=39947 RepID=B9FY52_ORYSJ|nr:hypothetical protein OsJ_24917 [Oryza sativa Japonica Group]